MEMELYSSSGGLALPSRTTLVDLIIKCPNFRCQSAAGNLRFPSTPSFGMHLRTTYQYIQAVPSAMYI